MEARMRTFTPAGIVLAILVALSLAFACPQEAFAGSSPWGSGTSYNAKTKTLTVKSGKHSIKLTKKRKGETYKIEKLVIKGGTTKLNQGYGYLKSLKVSKGKLTSKTSISVLGDMKVAGGTVSVSSAKRYGYALLVSGDLTVSGGKVIAKTTKEGCSAIYVYGDMKLKKGSVTATTWGKNAGGLGVGGYLRVYGGALKSTTSGKYGKAVQVSGDLIMTKGSIDATSERDVAVRCSDLLKVTGGKISARSASGEMALYSGETAVITPGCLGAIRGILPVGAQFSSSGVTYRVTDSGRKPAVKVVSGSAAVSSVSFGGVTYEIESSLVPGSIA